MNSSTSTNPVFDLNEQVAGQYQQAARWASLLERTGKAVELRGTGEAYPFHFEWLVFDGWNGPRIASIDIDGCGASWHGPDALWLKVIGPSEGVTA